MLEILLAFTCIGSNLKDQVCQQAWNKYNEQHPEISDFERQMQTQYVDTLPGGAKIAGGIIAVAFRHELKFSVYHNFVVDLRAYKGQSQELLQYRITFP